MSLERTSGPTRMTRELAQRCSGGINVVLSWSPATNRLFVDVEDTTEGDAFRIVVGGAEALDAFNHPYAYLEAA